MIISLFHWDYLYFFKTLASPVRFKFFSGVSQKTKNSYQSSRWKNSCQRGDLDPSLACPSSSSYSTQPWLYPCDFFSGSGSCLNWPGTRSTLSFCSPSSCSSTRSWSRSQVRKNFAQWVFYDLIVEVIFTEISLVKSRCLKRSADLSSFKLKVGTQPVGTQRPILKRLSSDIAKTGH